MKIQLLVLPLVAVWLGGCASLPSTRDVIPASGRVALVTHFAPTQQMLNVGTTAFQNKLWEADTGFDADAEALAAVQAALTREVKLTNGGELELPPPDRTQRPDPALAERLAALGREWQADVVLVLTTGVANDWIGGTNQRLAGFGIYRREFLGMKRSSVYAVLELRAVEGRTGKLIGIDREQAAREVPQRDWHGTWAEFSPMEKRLLLQGWHELFKESIPLLLTKGGLAQATKPKPEFNALRALYAPPRISRSWLPEGNQLDLPPGVTHTQAHDAVLNGVRSRHWTVVSDTPERVTAVYRDGAKEAGVAIAITDAAVVLTPEDHAIAADGSRRPASYERWQRNLKESIYRALLAVEPETAALEPVRPPE